MYLSRHHLLASRDIDELRDELGKRFTPHELNIAKAHGVIDAEVRGCAVNDLGLLSFSYGKDAPIRAATDDSQCSDVISINFLTSGSGRLHQRGGATDMAPHRGIVIDMARPFELDLQGYGGVAMVVGHETLRRHARALIGERAGRIDFQMEAAVDLATPQGRALKNAVVYALHEMDGDLGALHNPIALANLENYLLAQLIALHPSALRRLIEADGHPVMLPRNIKRARDYIYAHAREKITLEDLATYAGCGYRSLQSGFVKELGVSPMEYLKNVRLDGFHGELLNGDGRRETVAEVAGRWGFVHMGRLARMYKRRFGVLPSDTLRQRR
ncbi:MAG: hypothetical protein COX57_00510 [Alphaproteobacteria bacterium CG_4_10_14_0_2_um_filter_63_37]|nr:MAG: hypothetical protein AUJ55_05905 [Proteobacteria bacterium CG1_02_64_396]PJA25992.1 MAG: hypothetical protein COX57_00510 [Alphaproteobacteria bacterium CG_4_10_14_0_2_um_filter_63_37]